MSIQNKDRLSSYIRGGDTLAHRIHLWWKNTTRSVVIVMIVTALVWSASFMIFSSPTQRDLVKLHVASEAADAIFLGRMIHLNLSVRGEDGSVQYLVRNVAAQDVAAAVDAEYSRRSQNLFWVTGCLALVCGCITAAIVVVLQTRYGRTVADDQLLRGQELVSAQELKSLIEADGASEFTLGGIPIPRRKLARGIGLIGSMGGGKSQGMWHLLDVASFLLMRMVVYDPSGEFVASMYRPGKDYILNPLDARCANWQVFNDLENDFDYYALACFFVPLPKEGANDPIWINSARTLLADLIRIVNYGDIGPRSMRNIYDIAVKWPLDKLAIMLREYGVASAGQINEKNPRSSESIRMTLADALKFFPYIPDVVRGAAPFSIRQWMLSTDNDSRLFLTSRMDMRETLKPYLAMWLQLALMAAMTRPVNHGGDPDLFLALDEIASLGRIEALNTVLTEGRKWGILTAVGMQNLSQLDDEYGHDVAKTLIANLRSKLIFAVDEYSSAERLAKIIGAADIEEKSEGTSYGVEAERDGLNISSKRGERNVVMPVEITKLEDLEAYAKIPGNYPIAKVKVPFVPRSGSQPGFVMRSGLSIAEVMAASAARKAEMASDDGDPPEVDALPSIDAPDTDGEGFSHRDEDWLSL